MAHKKRRRSKARKHHCAVKHIKGQGRRRICRDRKGRIRSNTKA